LKYLNLFRAHQWVKNLLCYLPLFTSGMIFQGDKFATTTVGFFAMSFIASTGYIFNDIHDRQSDLENPYKSLRPISAGKISLRLGRVLMFLSFLSGLFLGFTISLPAGLLLFFYLGAVACYTLYFKKIAILNTFFLASFYVFRVFFGGLTSEVSISFWLAMFVSFFFLGLALSKKVSDRFLEMGFRSEMNSSLNIFIVFGSGSSFLSILTFALYINDPIVLSRFNHQKILWCIIPIIFYFSMQFWFDCSQGKIKIDPVLYCFKSRPLMLSLFLAIGTYSYAAVVVG
jgi:4-hydroxybenzoate polyprenyltransferase